MEDWANQVIGFTRLGFLESLIDRAGIPQHEKDNLCNEIVWMKNWRADEVETYLNDHIYKNRYE